MRLLIFYCQNPIQSACYSPDNIQMPANATNALRVIIVLGGLLPSRPPLRYPVIRAPITQILLWDMSSTACYVLGVMPVQTSRRLVTQIHAMKVGPIEKKEKWMTCCIPVIYLYIRTLPVLRDYVPYGP